MKIGNPAAEAATAAAGVGSVRSQEHGKPAVEHQQRPAHEPQAAEAPASAQVQLSSAASSLLGGAQGADGDFDAEKVARISQAIANGSFRINPEVIADKMIANAQELLGKVGQ